MSWRLAFHSTKILFSYLVPYKVKVFRDAIFKGNIPVIREMAAERPRLLQQVIDSDGNTALGLAILLGEVDVVKTLLELKSDPNLANGFDGNHPLVILAKLRTEENSKTPILAELLLAAGSNPLHEVRYQADRATRLDATQTPSYHETPLLCCGK
jgi:ankyrin repeat protein